VNTCFVLPIPGRNVGCMLLVASCYVLQVAGALLLAAAKEQHSAHTSVIIEHVYYLANGPQSAAELPHFSIYPRVNGGFGFAYLSVFSVPCLCCRKL